jgi:hypothetical protein
LFFGEVRLNRALSRLGHAERVPDQGLYHPTQNPGATIKVNFTEKFVKALHLLSKVSHLSGDPEVENARVRWIQSIVAHEILHAWQYHTGPTLDFERLPGSEISKQDFKKVLSGHEKKIQYEMDAEYLTLSYLKQGNILKLTEAVQEYQATHPEEFSETGVYRLLANERKNPFVGRYLIESARASESYQKTGELGHSWEMIYLGQIEPGKVLSEAQALLSSIEQGSMDTQTARAKWDELSDRLSRFTGDDLWQKVVKPGFDFCGHHEQMASSVLNEIGTLLPPVK